ncbi:unnamed protein product, partial [Didymodactylos carnosus]
MLIVTDRSISLADFQQLAAIYSIEFISYEKYLPVDVKSKQPALKQWSKTKLDFFRILRNGWQENVVLPPEERLTDDEGGQVCVDGNVDELIEGLDRRIVINKML